MLILQSGRPATDEGRLEKEIRVYDLLDSLGVEYGRLDHEPAMNMEVCEQIEKSLKAVICKNLFLCNKQQTQFYLLMIPGERKFKTKDLSRQLGVSRLSFAPESYMEEYLDITPGSVSVMGLMNDVGNHVRLVIDAEVLESEYIGCHPCINTSSIRMRTADLLDKVIPAMGHEPVVVDLRNQELDVI